MEGCYDPSNSTLVCSIDAKWPYNVPEQEGCTFNDPTAYGYSSRKVQVNRNQVPTSPHIHGLETRPAFDGNPLSWFNNVGDKGVGYFSLNNSKYFTQFNNPDVVNLFPSLNQQKNMKIIKASNNQLPGFLLYHDHAMRSSQYNFQHGLRGGYIIYD